MGNEWLKPIIGYPRFPILRTRSAAAATRLSAAGLACPWRSCKVRGVLDFEVPISNQCIFETEIPA